MNAREFFYLVAQMRTAQQEYFKTRNGVDLRRARYLEGCVDTEIRRVKEIVSVEELQSV